MLALLKPSIVTLPVLATSPSNVTMAALISNVRPDGSTDAVNVASCVFLRVKFLAVIIDDAAFGVATVSPLAKCPTIPAAFMLKFN